MVERTPSVCTNQVQPSKVETKILLPRQARALVRAAKIVYLESSFGLCRVTRKEALSLLPRRKKLAPQGIRVSSMLNGQSVAVSAVS